MTCPGCGAPDDQGCRRGCPEVKMNSLEHDLKVEMERARGERRLADLTCTVCRAQYPFGGQQTGPIWGIWGPGFQVCKGCVDAGRDERRRRERETKEVYPSYHPEEFK